MTLDFFRYEHKYLIPSYLSSEIMSFLSHKGKLDPYNKNNTPYEIRSIYFDSPSLTFYREKIAGCPDRRKIRVRSYSKAWNEEGGLFLEIKSKRWEKISKERYPITRDQMELLLNKEYVISRKDLENEVFRKVWYYREFYRLSPKVVVCYKRISFIDRIVDLKISFDSQIKAVLPERMYEDNFLVPVLDTGSIVEVKFNRVRPGYYFDFIKEFNLQLISFSKYCRSLERVGSGVINNY